MNSTEINTSLWQDFCVDLIKAKQDDVLEDDYQELIESALRLLGWSKVKGEICPKERINVGSHNQLEPDITLKINGKSVCIIEVKRPRNTITKRQEEQLLSYMRIRQNVFGLYIGDEIRLYYDVGGELPQMVWYSFLDLDSDTGYEFVDFFKRSSFNYDKIKTYCEDRHNHIKSNDIMTAFQQALKENQDATIRQTLTDYFVNYKKCNLDLVKAILEPLHFGSSLVSNNIPNDNNSQNYSSNGIVVSSKSSDKSKRDTTKYSLDGGKTLFGKGKFVWEVINSFVTQNPNLDYSQLAKIFPDELQGSYGVLRTMCSLEQSSQNKKDLFSRYEVSKPLLSNDNIKFVVCNQWGKYNFNNILNLLSKWGWTVVSN